MWLDFPDSCQREVDFKGKMKHICKLLFLKFKTDFKNYYTK